MLTRTSRSWIDPVVGGADEKAILSPEKIARHARHGLGARGVDRVRRVEDLVGTELEPENLLANRAMAAMLEMTRIDIAALRG